MKFSIKKNLQKIWDGFLNNIGATLFSFLVVICWFVIQQIKHLQNLIRKIPSDYILWPLLILLIILVILFKIIHRQHRKILDLKGNFRFISHFGVWWKIFDKGEYIEDFPYCPCCEPKIKLIQTNWYPHETFECPKSNKKISLYCDGIPRERGFLLDGLYRIYFQSFDGRVRSKVFLELNRIKKLNPEITDKELTQKLFDLSPLCHMPKKEKEKIIEKFSTPRTAFEFVNQNYLAYKKYFTNSKKEH